VRKLLRKLLFLEVATLCRGKLCDLHAMIVKAWKSSGPKYFKRAEKMGLIPPVPASGFFESSIQEHMESYKKDVIYK